jgi:hypothetical protein
VQQHLLEHLTFLDTQIAHTKQLTFGILKFGQPFDPLFALKAAS